MEEKTTPRGSLLMVITIILTGICFMHDMVIVPSVYGIYEAFPDQMFLANFIVSGPAAVMLITMLASSVLMKRFSKKGLTLVALIVFAISTICGALVKNALYMAVMRALVGLSVGIIAVVPVAIFSEIYDDENKRGWIMGIYNAVMSGAGALLSIIAGSMAVNGWDKPFRLYWFSVPIIALWILFAPGGKSVSEQQVGKNSSSKSHFKITWVLRNMITYLLVGSVYSILYYQVSVIVTENNIGNELLAGTLSSFGTVGSLVLSFFFGAIYKKLNHSTYGISMITLGIGFLILTLFHTVPAAMIACALVGASFGVMYSAYMMELTTLVPPEHIGTSMSIGMASAGCALFVSTYLASFLQTITGSDTVTGILPVCVGICIVVGVLELITNLIKNGRK